MRLTLIAMLFVIGLVILYATDPAPYPNIPKEFQEPKKKMRDFFPEMQEVVEPEAASGFEKKAVVESSDFMVVTAHPLASKVARDMLQRGGSAADAVIAAQLMLNLVEPQSSGIGGGGFLLYYDAASKVLHSYDGRETSPAAFDSESFLNTVEVDGAPVKVKQSFKEALEGAVSVGTPGLLKMLDMVHRAHGSLAWHQLFTPTIEKAKEGFIITPRLKKLLDYAPNVHEHFPFETGYVAQHYEVGNVVTNPKFAATLELIASESIAPFYEGDIAQHIVDVVQREDPPGTLSLSDLASYEAVKQEALCAPYHVYTICSPSPPSGGITLQQIMGMLQHFDMAQYDAKDVTGWHLLAQATQLAFADRTYVADLKAMAVSSKQLLDSDYLMKRASLMRMDGPKVSSRPGFIDDPDLPRPLNFEPPSTTHLSVIDAQGNIASLTSSIEHAFGAGVMVDGFFLNNQLMDFDWWYQDFPKYDPLENITEPNKRPRSSMSPTIVFDAQQRPILVIGSPGGSRIIPYIAKTLIAVLDWHMSLDEAIALPHIIAGADGKIAYEPSAHSSLIHALEQLGHDTYKRELTSGLHAIQVVYEENKARYIGAADPRREGQAIGQ